jgi:alpha-galactosidase
MALCVKALYDTFPAIKAFGCCHEVFGTQNFIAQALYEQLGIKVDSHRSIKVNVVGVNHFTWLTEAKYRDIDAMKVYKDFALKHPKGLPMKNPDSMFECAQRVKIDLFLRYGAIAAAGDRHLSEFVDGSWYLDSPQHVKNWGFKLTPVSWRKENLQERLERSRRLRSGEEEVKLEETGEDGIDQIRALLGLCDFTTNVNLPNVGQIPNLPLGAIVETNAAFRDNSVTPVMAGNVPEGVWALVSRSVDSQLTVAKAARERDLELAFRAFAADPLVRIDLESARLLFDEMVENTKEYLTEYFR